jgi:stage II sporulation SpoD-like protein/carboxypeptidase family protein
MGTGSQGYLHVREHEDAGAGARALRRAVVAALGLFLTFQAFPAAASPVAHIRGEVVSWETGARVAGATIALPGYGVRTTSGRDGSFAFPQDLATDHPYRRITAVVTAHGFGTWTIRRAPLVDGDTLQLHVELRSLPWTHTVLTREERAALPQAPTEPSSYSETCTGWKYTLAPPQKIWVWISADKVSKQYDFNFYARHVLPAEWISSWDADSLGAGAIAVKTYGWYRTQKGHAYSGGDGCADIQDNTSDQVFDPSLSYASTDKAVDATFGSILWKDGNLFLSQYYAGAEGDKCAPVTGQYAGRMSQWGTQTCALNSVLWPEIVTTFYDTGTQWNDIRNFLLNPRFESAAMYAWTLKGSAKLVRTEGGAAEGDWYGTLSVTKQGDTATLRNEQPFDGKSTTTYYQRVHIMCPTSHRSDCTVTLKVVILDGNGTNVGEHDKTVTVPNDGAWHISKWTTPEMGVSHSSVRFSLETSKQIGVDAAKLNTEYGGP